MQFLFFKHALGDKRYKKVNKIVFPIYLQIFFKVLILMPSREKISMGYKINHGRFAEITEDEIKCFASNIEKGFDDWDKNIIFENKDVIRDNVEVDVKKFKEGSLQIERLDNTDLYNDNERKYIQKKLELHRQSENFQFWVNRTFQNKCEVQKIKAEIDNMVKKHLDDIFELKIISIEHLTCCRTILVRLKI